MDNEKPEFQEDFYEGYIDFEAELKRSEKSKSVHDPHGLYDDFIDMEEQLENQQRVKSNSLANQDDFELLDDNDMKHLSNSVKIDSNDNQRRSKGNAIAKKGGGSKLKNILGRKKKNNDSVNITKIEVFQDSKSTGSFDEKKKTNSLDKQGKNTDTSKTSNQDSKEEPKQIPPKPKEPVRVVEKFKVGRKFIEFTEKDPIFKLTEAIDPKKDDMFCVFCERDMKDLERKYCEFCGHVACLRCCHKKSSFQVKPGQTEALKGLSCRVCDRKFMQKNFHSREMDQVVYLSQWELNENENILQSTKTQIQTAQDQIKQFGLQEKQNALDFADKEKQQKKQQTDVKKVIQEREPKLKELESQKNKENRKYDEEKMDNQMEEMTMHNLKTQCKQMDDKVTKLLSLEVQTLYQNAYEVALLSSSQKEEKPAASIEEKPKKVKPKDKEFNEEELNSKIEQMAPYERLNFLRKEFDLGRNPQQQRNASINFQDEDDILNNFHPGKIIMINNKQRDYLLTNLRVQAEKKVETDGNDKDQGDEFSKQQAAAADRSNASKSLVNRNDSLYSSASTHKGGSLHIPGFGEAHDFRYDEDNSLSSKNRFNAGQVDKQGSNFSYKINTDDQTTNLSQSQSQLDMSQDSQGNPLTEEQKQNNIQVKMKRKQEQKKKLQKKMKEARKNNGITNPDQQCCHNEKCTIF